MGDMMQMNMTENPEILTKLSPEKLSRLVGDIVLLMASSPMHRHFPVQDVVDLMLPAVQLNQFRIYHDGAGKPVGLVCWAKLSDEVLKKYTDGQPLSLQERESGDLLFFTDFIAPFGHAKKIAKEFKYEIFPNDMAYGLRWHGVGKPRKEIVPFYGANYKKQSADKTPTIH